MSNNTKPLRCPICKKEVDPASADAPFCSDRCRVLDLGKWASGDYKISAPIDDPDILEELSRSNRNNPTSSDDE